jgi:multisubunit Na+/H+ antiporter MnhE subunit
MFNSVRSVLQLLLQWTGLLVLWFLFVYQFTTSELLVGAAASALSVLALQVTLRAVPLCFRPKLRWFLQGRRLPGMIAVDLWILLRELGRRALRKRSRSLLEIVNFGANGTNCRGSAQRALAILFVSTSPNSVVLHVDRETGDMLVHKLKPQPVPPLVSKLEA